MKTQNKSVFHDNNVKQIIDFVIPDFVREMLSASKKIQYKLVTRKASQIMNGTLVVAA
jgi:hypothetical protein